MSYNDIYLDLRTPGLYLIHGRNRDAFGSNGAGKSAALELLVWTLWGTTLRGLTGDQVINTRTRGGCYGQIDIDNNGNRLRLERVRKRADRPDGLNIYIRRKPAYTCISDDWSSTQAQEYVEKLLGMDGNVFINTVFFGQGTRAKAFAGATDAEQKKIFLDLIGMDVWDAALKVAKEEHAELESEQRADERELEHGHGEVNRIADNLKYEKQQADSWADSNAGWVKSASDTLGAASDDVDAAAQVVVETGATVADNDEPAPPDMGEYHKLISDAQDEDQEWGRMNGRIKVLESEIAKADRAADQVKNQDVATCPTCGQDINDKHAETILEGYYQTAENARVELADLYHDIDAVLESANARRDAAGKIKYDAQIADEAYQRAQDARKAFEVAQHTLETCLARKSDAERALNNVLEQRNPHTGQIARFESQLIECEKSMHATVERVTGREKLIAATAWWVRGFGRSGIQAYAVDRMLPVLNAAASRYAERLTDGTVEIEFRGKKRLKSGADKISLNLVVKNTAGAAIYKGNSGGEKRRIDLCVQLALQDLVACRAGNDVNIRIYDEPFDALDEEGRERAVDLLRDLAARGYGVYVVTQDAGMRAHFDHVYTAEKIDGVSRLTVGGAE